MYLLSFLLEYKLNEENSVGSQDLDSICNDNGIYTLVIALVSFCKLESNESYLGGWNLH